MTSAASAETIRQALIGWLVKHNPGLEPAGVSDDSRLIENRWLTSVQILDLLGLLEELREEAIPLDALRPGSFATIGVIIDTFFGPAARS
ncbi:MAG: hypothetical protein ACT4OS_05810 [Acidimicrobiales bacterium]